MQLPPEIRKIADRVTMERARMELEEAAWDVRPDIREWALLETAKEHPELVEQMDWQSIWHRGFDRVAKHRFGEIVRVRPD